MKHSRKVLSTILCIAVIAVFSLTIAYAVLSKTLTISGSSAINASTWDIGMKNSEKFMSTTTGSATYTTPIVSGTTISYSAGLTKPGDSVTLYFDFTNEGTLNGELTSIVKSNPTCTSKTGSTADADLVCNNLEVTIKYSDGTNVSVGDVINENGSLCIGAATIAEYIQPAVKVEVKLKDTMTSIPSSKVTITNLNHEFIFSQTNKSCTTYTCFTGDTKVAVENGYKNIKDIKVGDLVYSYNLDIQEKELKPVTKVFKHKKNELYTLKVNNRIINTTEEHPFYVVNKGWKEAKKLDFSDKLLSLKNGAFYIESIKIHQFDKVDVYNITVKDNHNYLITDQEFLVHNKGEPI